MENIQSTKPSTEQTKKPTRRELRKAGRIKRVARLKTDKEFAKSFFEGKSKRALDKKVTYKRRMKRKK